MSTKPFRRFVTSSLKRSVNRVRRCLLESLHYSMRLPALLAARLRIQAGLVGRRLRTPNRSITAPAVIGFFILAVTQGVSAAAPQVPPSSKISSEIITKSVDRANDLTGRVGAQRVKVKFEDAGPGIRVRQLLKEGEGAETIVKGNPPKTEAFELETMWLREKIPAMFINEDTQIEVLAQIFVHEFSHMPVQEGGEGLVHDRGCAELKGRERDSLQVCARIREIGQDSTLTPESKCARIKALCQLMREIMVRVNVQANLNAAAACTDAPYDIDVSDGQIYDACCPECCAITIPEAQCRVTVWDY